MQLAFVPFLVCACSSSPPIFEPVHADDLEDAGSVHLAVLAVARWSDYASALQPDFHLDGDAAVKEVARDSRWQSRESLTNAQAGMQSTLLQQPNNPTGLQPAQPNLPPFPQAASPDERATSPRAQPPPSSADPADLPKTGPDSMLKYTAATALYQEVQLLNRHIRDAAIPAGFRPYMVRLQLSLMPSRRHAPYDVYTTLSFFLPGAHADASKGGPQVVRSTMNEIFHQPFGNGPKVLPLVVTDNLESSVKSASLDRVRGLTASLLEFQTYDVIGGMTAKFLGEVVRPMYYAMLAKAMREEVYGRDMNSLLTIARVSENTLRIRLGAMQEATANYAMVPRNHNITLLLMVPEGAPSLVEVVAKVALVDAETGKTLESPTDAERTKRLNSVLEGWNLAPMQPDTLAALHALAQRNDQKGFSALLRTSLPAYHPALLSERSLWIELVGMRIGDPYTSNMFELPGQGENLEKSAHLFDSQTVVAEDNGEFTYVTLREARFPESEHVLAVLRSTPAPATAPETPPAEEGAEGEAPPMDEGATDPAASDAKGTFVLPAESVKVDPARREIRLRFPSLQRWGLADGEGMELELVWAGRTKLFPVRLARLGAPSGDTVPTQKKSLEPAQDFDQKPLQKQPAS
jgi:hypothetical protein